MALIYSGNVYAGPQHRIEWPAAHGPYTPVPFLPSFGGVKIQHRPMQLSTVPPWAHILQPKSSNSHIRPPR